MDKLATILQHPRDQITEIIKRIYNAGLTTTSGGNISIKDDIITIPLEFEAFQSFFVVFPEETRTSGRENITGENFPQYSTLMELKGAWKVSFDPAWGGREEVVFANLEDWTDRAEEGIRHYSGIHSQP